MRALMLTEYTKVGFPPTPSIPEQVKVGEGGGGGGGLTTSTQHHP